MTERFRPTAAYVEAHRLDEEGSNWREFQGLLGWDILAESKRWTPPEPHCTRSLEVCLVGGADDEDSEWGEIMRGDWLVKTDGGRLLVMNDDAFRVLFEEFE